MFSLTSGVLLSLFVPYYLAFVSSRPYEVSAYTPFLWIFFLTDLLAVADLLKGFRTSFIKPDGSEVADPAEIARKYLKSYFSIDFLAAIPWILIGNVVLSARPGAYLISLVRFLRLIPQAWSTINSRVWQMVRLGGMLYLCTHWFACVWYVIAEGEEEWVPSHDLLLGTDIFEEDALNRYSVFWYTATTVLVQGGEFFCHSSLDAILMILAELAGVIGFTLIFSKVCLIVQDESNCDSVLHSKLNSAESASLELNLPASLHRQVLSAVSKHANAIIFESLVVLNSLQDSIYLEVMTAILAPIAEDRMLSVMLSRDVHAAFLSRLNPVVCLPEEVLFHEFEQKDAMYVVARGELTAELISLKETLFHIHQGDLIGVPCVWTVSRRCSYTATARGSLLLFSITSARVRTLTEKYPRLKAIFEARMWEESDTWFSRCRPFIDKLPYFANIPRRAKLELALSAHIKAYENESKIVTKGEPLSDVVGVYSGTLGIQIQMRRKAMTIEELNTGSVFGVYTAAKATNVQTVDVLALESTLCLVIPADLIRQLSLSLPVLSCFNSNLHDTADNDFVRMPLTRPTPNSRLRAVVLRILRGAYAKGKLNSVGLASYLVRRPLTHTVRLNKDIWTILQRLPSAQAAICDKMLTVTSQLNQIGSLTPSKRRVRPFLA